MLVACRLAGLSALEGHLCRRQRAPAICPCRKGGNPVRDLQPDLGVRVTCWRGTFPNAACSTTRVTAAPYQDRQVMAPTIYANRTAGSTLSGHPGSPRESAEPKTDPSGRR